MAGDTSEGTRQLDQTPTWAVAGVCAVIIIVSIALEKVFHKLGKFFTDKHKRALFEALEKVKAGKQKHIEIRHHFIRDCNEKKLVQVVKIHTDQNFADLLTKAFDVGRFQYLVASIGMLNP